METRLYQAQGIDIERLAIDLERTFQMQGYTTQHFGGGEQMTVQLRKGGDFAAFMGMRIELTLTMQLSPGGLLAMAGQQKWADKAAAGAVGMLIFWPMAFTAGAGAIQQSQLGVQAMNLLDRLVYQQDPNVRIGPIPPNMMPVNQPPGPIYGPPGPVQGPLPPPARKVTCPHCGALNDEGDNFCMGCGKPVTLPEPVASSKSQKAFCPMCNAQLKPHATFCTQCGTPLAQDDDGT